ncbi:ABC transporter ATP-binding protein [Amphibiibacter pelophylacis]|uniref:ABC transporter ATP-binding protein n=1 Tax=Amphibiibacter pelophylacis TaxID=1799477 RepID=A0ACC6P2W2_9BURK
MNTAPDFLLIDGLSRSHGRQRVLKDITLGLPQGALTVLLGPSGCGKSTLLRQIAGLEPLDGGRIVCQGQDLAATPPERRGFALVFQDHALFAHLSVYDNVAFAPTEQRLGQDEIARRTRRALEALQIAPLAQRGIHELSGGQQQRVAVARALAAQPRLLLLDEPFSSLDPGLREDLQHMLRELLHAQNQTALLVTHDQREAWALADRLAVMQAGDLVQAGEPDRLYSQPATPWLARFLGHRNLGDRAVWLDQDLRLLRPGQPVPPGGAPVPVTLSALRRLGAVCELSLTPSSTLHPLPPSWGAGPPVWQMQLSRREWLALDSPETGQALVLRVDAPGHRF